MKRMIVGYAHEYPHLYSPVDDMELVCYTPTGREVFNGYRMIDGSAHAVFYCQRDGKYRAQTCVSLGLNPEKWEINVGWHR